MNYLKVTIKQFVMTLIAAGSIALIGGCHSSTAPPAVVTLTSVQITAVDGYMIGCTVTDSTTPIALVATEVDATNSPGVYRFDPATPPNGPITSSGCTDLSTGLSVPTLKTPAVPVGQTQVVATPLAALVQARIEQGRTVAEASADIIAAFGLPDVDLSTFDPIAEVASAANPAIAAQIQAVATQVIATISAIESAESGTSDAVFSAIIDQVTAATTTGITLDLTSSATLTTIIADSTTPGIVDATATVAIANAVVAVNTSIETAADSITLASTAADRTSFLVDTSAATIVVDAMDTEIVAAVGGDPSTLVSVTLTVDDDITTETASVNTDGLTSDPVEPTTVVVCPDGSTADTIDLCPVATGATGATG